MKDVVSLHAQLATRKNKTEEKKRASEHGYGICDLRSGGSHLAEKTGTSALLGGSWGWRSLRSSRRVSSGRVRLLLLAIWRTSRLSGCSRTSGSAARGSRSSTTALARHVD